MTSRCPARWGVSLPRRRTQDEHFDGSPTYGQVRCRTLGHSWAAMGSRSRPSTQSPSGRPSCVVYRLMLIAEVTPPRLSSTVTLPCDSAESSHPITHAHARGRTWQVSVQYDSIAFA